MKKLIVVTCLTLVAFGFLLVVLVGAWWLWHWRHAVRPLPPLRAMMRDQNVPRPLEPSLALQVNDGREAVVFAETPLWLSVGVVNAAALNETAAAPRSIKLGDAARPWTAAVELVTPDGHGAEPKRPFPVPLLGTAPAAVELDAVRSTEALFGAASPVVAPGSYLVTACLGATGSWKGRVCSSPVKLTVTARPAQLTPEQELAIARQTGRFGLLAGDPLALETAGRRMLAADKTSVEGHMYFGEARYRQEKWREALGELTAARAELARQHPGPLERPSALDVRIGQLLEKVESPR